MQRILVTGGAGKVATLLRPLLPKEGRVVRLLDIVRPEPMPDLEPEELIVGSLNDPAVLSHACRDVDAIVHLAGQTLEASLDVVLEHNVAGTMRLLEAANAADIRRVILASSNHVAGFHELSPTPVPGDVTVRPDTLYGWSKAAVEAAGRMYHDRYGMDIICIRIGSWVREPADVRGLAMWLSPGDGHRMIEACLECPRPGYRIIWGVSRNTRRRVSLTEGEGLGYYPLDNAERWAIKLVGIDGAPDFGSDPDLVRIGGAWCRVPIGVPMLDIPINGAIRSSEPV